MIWWWFQLVDGNYTRNGPVIEALERGAILLLDEIDLASNKILCLQSILEGKGVFLKKIGKYIKPADGFNVIATANTKGKGSDDGRFIGTNVLNEAFLERFPVTFEQSYPAPSIENKILNRICDDSEFVSHLVDWADIIQDLLRWWYRRHHYHPSSGPHRPAYQSSMTRRRPWKFVSIDSTMRPNNPSSSCMIR